MKAIRWMASLLLLAALGLGSTPKASAQAAGGAAPAGQAPAAGASQQKYTMAEYNSYQATAAEKNPAAQIKLLDDFVSKYPNSALLNYIYPLYYKNYFGQKNYPKAIEYCDKMIVMGGKVSPAELYDAYYVRAYAFNAIQNPDAETAKAARASALAGLKVLDQIPKPDGVDDAKFAAEKQQSVLLFNGTAANAAMAAKDYPGAIDSYQKVLAFLPDDLISNYKLGQAYNGMTPPQTLDALWYFARAATSKNANEQQSKSIKAYVRKAIANYQGGTVCDPLTDAEMNELLQLAPNSVTRPATYKLVSSAELDAARKDMTIASVVTDLKAGGDKAKLTWTASCGLEFPDVPGKLIEVVAGTDTIELKIAFVTSDAEFQAATTPNLDVIIKTADQPAAAKLEKDNVVHFTGTLESYDPDPAFMLHWDKAKVNEEDLPKDNKKPAAKKPAAKKPS
jgi:tetratricopeptide (TPR) repeat protein